MNPATTQAHNQDYEVAHPKIRLNYEMLEHMIWPDLQIQSYRTSMTQGNNRISKRSPSGGPVLIVSTAKVRGLKPEQRLTAMNTSKAAWREEYIVTY